VRSLRGGGGVQRTLYAVLRRLVGLGKPAVAKLRTQGVV